MAKEYIERDALKPLEEMEYIYFTSPATVPYYEADKVWEVLDNIHTADVVEVKHGRWKEVDYWSSKNGSSIHYIANQCSACHCNSPRKAQYNYCPNCGAKMDISRKI